MVRAWQMVLVSAILDGEESRAKPSIALVAARDMVLASLEANVTVTGIDLFNV